MTSELLRINPGETEAEAIERWWEEFGLDPTEAQRKRKETYARQKVEAQATLRRRGEK